ncbi:MAG: DUF3618 domain-containing protein [Acidobacteriota bacterium]
MAERPSELDEKTLMNVDEKHVVIKAAESSEKETNTDENTEVPDQIRANIEETRAEMSETIDAIQERLSFSNISEQVKSEVSDFVGETIQTAKNTVYDAVIEKVGFIMNYADKRINEISDTEIVKTARRNPLTLGLIGLGIGVLFFSFNKKNKKSKRSHYRYDADYDERDYGRGVSSKDKKSPFLAAQSKVSDAAGKVGDTVSSAAGAVSDTVSSAAGAVSDTVSDVANKTYQQVGNLGSKAQDFAGTAQDSYEHYMEENPLAVGAVALALGAAVGLAIPSTKIENQYMGEARNNLLQKAEVTARDAVEKVQQVAGQVKETVKEEAKSQGLT